MPKKTAMLFAALIATGQADADESAPPALSPAPQSQQERWLNEVRAQRQAWEAQREAAREASNARLRILDPWGAARLEALEQKSRARQEALRERNAQYLEQLQAQDQALEAWRQQVTPYGWDNRWYYRGY